MQCINLIEKYLEQWQATNDRSTDGANTTAEPAQYLGPDQPYLDMTKSSFATSTPRKPRTSGDDGDDIAASATTIPHLDDGDDPDATVLSEYVDVTSPTEIIVEEDNVNYANQSNGDPTTTQRNVPSLGGGSSTQYDQLQFDGWSRVNFNSPSSTASEFRPHDPTSSADDADECPFGGLPATHLRMRQCAHIGWLIEPRRYLPKKGKRYYAGVLDGWLIMYSGGEAAIRPSACYALRKCSWSDSQELTDKCKLTLISDAAKPKKKRHFQMNQEELQKWMVAFDDAKPAMCANYFGGRKLPTPPPNVVDTKTGNESSVHSTVVSSAASTVSLEMEPKEEATSVTRAKEKTEEIYEEPVELLASLNKLRAKRLEPQPVAIIDVLQEYDIPKPKPRPVNSDHHPAVQPKSFAMSSGGEQSTRQMNDENSFQENKSKVAAKLSAASVSSPANLAIRQKSGSIKDLRGDSRASRRRSSFSYWLHRLSRRGRRSVHTVTKPGRIAEVDDDREPTQPEREPSATTAWKFGSPTKGGKVNQIISQLEANGHRVAINRTKAHKWSRSGVGGGGGKKASTNGNDDHNYEPVSVVTA